MGTSKVALPHPLVAKPPGSGVQVEESATWVTLWQQAWKVKRTVSPGWTVTAAGVKLRPACWTMMMSARADAARPAARRAAARWRAEHEGGDASMVWVLLGA